MKNKKGFTLVEMLIVVVIIGVLAAALIPRLLGAQSQARDVARKKGMSDVKSVFEIFYNNIGTYPTTYHNYCIQDYEDFVNGKNMNLHTNNGTVTKFRGLDIQTMQSELKNITSEWPKDPQKNHINYGSFMGNTCKGSYVTRDLSDSNSYSDFASQGGFVISANMENFGKNMNIIVPYEYDYTKSIKYYQDMLCPNGVKFGTPGNCQTNLASSGGYALFSNH